MLEYFEELSRDRSPEKRRELMFKITDRFLLGADRYEDRQQSLFIDIANHVLGEMADDDQVDYGMHAATQEALPHAVVKNIATGDTLAALPVLEHSETLTDEDLIEVASSKGHDRLHAIAKRRHLNTEVTDVLVERGDDGVLHTVTSNSGARFSEQGFDKLTERSAGNRQILDNLARRNDLPENVAEEILPKLDKKAAERLRGLMAKDGHAAIDVLAKVKEKTKDAERANRNNRLQAKIIASDIASGKISPEQGLDKIVGFGRIDDIAHVAAAAFDIDEKILANALRAKDGSPAAMLFRSAKMAPESFMKFEETRCIALQRAFDDHSAKQLYSRITPDDASKAVRFLKLRQAV